MFDPNKSENERLIAKWKPLLEHKSLPPIDDYHKKAITAKLLENQEQENRRRGSDSLLTEAAGPVSTNTVSNFASYDPVLISMIRRAMPNLIAYDLCGVQALNQPNGLIFSLRAKYGNQRNATNPGTDVPPAPGTETFYNEVASEHSAGGRTNSVTYDQGTENNPDGHPDGTYYADADGTAVLDSNGDPIPYASPAFNPFSADGSGDFYAAHPYTTEEGERLGTENNDAFNEMSMDIDRINVTVGTRALKAEYSVELAQDLKAMHGLDAETELANILSNEILAEINREIIRKIYLISKAGAQNTNTPGIFDMNIDSRGRWQGEQFKGIFFQLEREANQLAKETRRGRGNIVLCSSNVASALMMAGVLDTNNSLTAKLNVDDTGNTYAGTIGGRVKVYIDPYAVSEYMVLGYKGTNAYEAGMFYCPYVPLQMVRAVDPNSFQPKIGFKTRYGLVHNPFALTEEEASNDSPLARDFSGNTKNLYYRSFRVTNL